MGCILNHCTEENSVENEPLQGVSLSLSLWRQLKDIHGSYYQPYFKKENTDEEFHLEDRGVSSRIFPDLIPIEIETELYNSHHTNKYHIPLSTKSSQTDPIPESAFDWSYSDKNDIETQTRSWAPHYYDDETVRDAISQTDQRLAFLLERSLTQVPIQNAQKFSVEVSVQTLIATSDIGVQVNLGDTSSFQGGVPLREVKQRVISRRRRTQPKETIEITYVAECAVAGRTKREDTLNKKLNRQSKKDYLLGLDDPFARVDEWATYIKLKKSTDLNNLHTKLISILYVSWTAKLEPDTINLLKVRLYFRWIAQNIRFDGRALEERDPKVESILENRIGVSHHFVKLFEEFCKLGGVPVKSIYGFAKNADFKPNEKFTLWTQPNHAWNTVFLGNTWRLLDCSWGILYDDSKSWELDLIDHDDHPSILIEHFFLTDPEEFILTHFPYEQNENQDSQWQLLSTPITLKQFNDLPVLSSSFFDHRLKLINTFSTKNVKETVSIMIKSPSPLRYEWKFYSVDKDDENEETHRNEVLCYLKGRNRRLGYFQIRPKHVGSYFLKIYGKPENKIYRDEDDSLDHLATIFINVIEVMVNIIDWPRIDVPWGLTPSFYELGLVLLHQNEPIIPLICGASTKVIFVTNNESIVTLPHLYDTHGNELLIDQCRDFQYCVLLSKKNPLPGYILEGEESSLVPYVQKEETRQRVIFTINSPSNIGDYKLQIYGGPKPGKRGKYNLPLLASFLIQVRGGHPPAKKQSQ